MPLALRYSVPDFAGMSSGRRNAYSEQLVIHVGEGMLPQVLDRLETEWRQFDPNHPFEFRFLNDTLNELYGSEQRLMQQVAIFSGLCILISCLGLFGLSAFNTAQRTREIGIRQSVGATPADIRWQFLTEALMLSLVGGLIGVVAGVSGAWLFGASGDMRTVIVPSSILLAFGSAAAVGVFFGYFPATKAAQLDPIEALRHE